MKASRTHDVAVKQYFKNLADTPYGIGSGILRERLLSYADFLLDLMKHEPEIFNEELADNFRPVFSDGMWEDLFKRIQRELNYEDGVDNNTALKNLYNDLYNTPYSVGLGGLRELLLFMKDRDERRIASDPEDFQNPLFPTSYFSDLYKRMEGTVTYKTGGSIGLFYPKERSETVHSIYREQGYEIVKDKDAIDYYLLLDPNDNYNPFVMGSKLWIMDHLERTGLSREEIEKEFESIREVSDQRMKLDEKHTYKFRAEVLDDVYKLIRVWAIRYHDFVADSFVIHKDKPFPDIEVTITTNLSKESILKLMMEVEDSHVMIETLELESEYTGERDRSGKRYHNLEKGGEVLYHVEMKDDSRDLGNYTEKQLIALAKEKQRDFSMDEDEDEDMEIEDLEDAKEALFSWRYRVTEL